MPLPLYFDECVDARIISGLRRRGVDLVTAAGERLLAASDEEHLRRASKLGRAVVTCDHDFLGLVKDLDVRHSGLLFILPRTNVGVAVRAIALAAEVLSSPDIENSVEWIPG